MAVKNVLVLRWSQRAHCFVADPKSRLEPPKGTLPYGKGLVTSENPGKVKTVQGIRMGIGHVGS